MRANLEVFAETLLELAQQERNLLVLTSDSRGSGKLAGFAQALPSQLIEMGIAEQNLVGVAAGLASAGKKVFAVSPACFLSARAFEQIKNDVAYSNHPVRLVGISAGVSYGALGATHHSLHDLATFQAVPNLDIVIPADSFETRQAILAAIHHLRPLYLRFGKHPLPVIHPPETQFQIGKAISIRQGGDAWFIATGETVHHCLQAGELLRQKGLSVGVTSLHSLRPFDEAAVLDAARQARLLVSVEEHSIHGGLGARCASLLLQSGVRVPFHIAGFPAEDLVSGSQAEVFAHYGLDAQGLARSVLSLVER
jgi:transketolase